MANLSGLSLITGAQHTDMDGMCALIEMGWEDRPLWAGMMRNVSAKDKRGFLVSVHSKRVGKPGSEYFRVVENATGTVAWTSLLYPRPSDSPALGGAAPIAMPSIPGMDERLAELFFSQSINTNEHGYDATQHFHRKGTFVHPDFQRRGLATLLQEQCNRVADEAGKATFALALPASKKLFDKGGFKVIAYSERDIDGDGTLIEERWVMQRDPRPVNAQ